MPWNRTTLEAAAIEQMKQTPGFRNHTWSMAFVLGSEVLVVTEAHLGLKYKTTISGRCPTYPVEYRCTWLPASTLPADSAITRLTSEADAKGGEQGESSDEPPSQLPAGTGATGGTSSARSAV